MHYQSVFRDDLFAGQVIVVTGGGSGIGRCIAHELASLGAGVVITGRQEAKLADVAVEISADGGAVDTLAFDIRDEEGEVERRQILSRGRIHGLSTMRVASSQHGLRTSALMAGMPL